MPVESQWYLTQSLFSSYHNNPPLVPLATFLLLDRAMFQEDRVLFETERAQLGLEPRLFVGNIDPSTTEEELQQYFEPFGEIKQACIIRDKDGNSKRSAFITFTYSKSARDAIEGMNEKVVDKSQTAPLVVRFAKSRPTPILPPPLPVYPFLTQPTGSISSHAPQLGQLPHPPHPQTIPGGSAPGYTQLVRQSATSTGSSRRGHPHGFHSVLPVAGATPTPTPPGHGQIHGAMVSTSTHSYPHGHLHNTAASIPYKPSYGSYGPYVAMPTSYPHAVPSNAIYYHPSRPTVSDHEYNDLARGNASAGADRPRVSTHQDGATSPGIVTAYHANLSPTTHQLQRGPPGANLYLNNLDPHADDATIRDLFGHYGAIRSIRLFPQHGYGFVSFEDATSARLAIQHLNYTAIGSQGKLLEVSVKKPKERRLKDGESEEKVNEQPTSDDNQDNKPAISNNHNLSPSSNQVHNIASSSADSVAHS